MANPLQLSAVNFKKGSYIIVEGKQKADHFYIIHKGRVKIKKEIEIVEEEGGNLLEPGDFFGVVSTMSAHSHIESAMAIDDATLISVHRDQYGLLINKNTPVAMKIIQGFSRKLRFLDEALTRLTFKTGVTREDPAHLFEIGEYYAKLNQYNQAFYAYYRYLQHCPSGIHAPTAKQRLQLIKPYAKAVHMENIQESFNRVYPKNTMVFSEHEPGKELYIIQKGSIKITKIVNDSEVMLAILKPGDIFGEMSLLENKPRSASAIAFEDSTLLAVNKANFQIMVKNQPQLITRLTTLLAERLWLLYKQLANTTLKDPEGKLYDALYMNLEKNRVRIGSQEAYSFEFGPKELLSMVGLPASEGNVHLQKLLVNKKIKIVDNKIYTSDVEDIKKQAEFFWKMAKREKARLEGKRI